MTDIKSISPLTIPFPHDPELNKQEEITEAIFEGLTAEEEQNAINTLYALIQAISLMTNRHHSDLMNAIREDMRHYKEESDKCKEQKDFQGWNTMTLTLVGAACAVLALPAFAPTDTIKGALTTASELLSKGVEPSQKLWSEAKISQKETNKQFLQLAYTQGQEAAKGSSHLVETLANTALRVYDVESKSKFRGSGG